MTMVADTAQSEVQDTADEQAGALAAGLLGETAPAELQTETDLAPETTETADPLADIDDEIIKQSPKVRAAIEAAEKSLEARKEESFRQRQEKAAADAKAQADAEAYQRNLLEAQEVERGSIQQALEKALVDSVDLDIDPQAVQRLKAQLPVLNAAAQQLTRATQMRNDRQYVDAANGLLQSKYPDYRIPQELVQRFDAALHKGDFTARMTVLGEIIEDAAVTQRIPKERESIAKQVRAEAQANARLEAQRQAEASANSGTRPTSVSGRGASSRSYQTKSQITQAFRDDLLSGGKEEYLQLLRAHRDLPDF